YDHKRRTVSRPVVVHDKGGVNDPHDNPSILIDDQGYLWVFVSGRGNVRKGYKYRSEKPYSIDAFRQVSEEVMAYPQPMFIPGQGYFHFFTKYTGVRELYFETSKDGITWTDDVKLAGIRKPLYEKSGHYQVSNHHAGTIFTFFNWHPNGNVDKRTNVYYVQTKDFGRTFETIEGRKLEIPIEDIASAARVKDYESKKKNVYICDTDVDANGYPVCLYLTSDGHEPGPQNGAREWWVLRWNGKSWTDSKVCESDHNYDMGSLFLHGSEWRIIAPTDSGPQRYGAGGEIVMWGSADGGNTWKRKKQVTDHSDRNHNYVRRVVNGRSPFLYFWADGDPNHFSPSHLYIGDENGVVRELPYEMKGNEQKLTKYGSD
ncbi:MAG TPA: BNR-4 repeat-containing protein, partial [Chryseosolibacter sp.]